MKPIIKKILKRTTISLLIILVLLGAAIAIALNFIFTPEKLTPKIEEMAKDYVNGDVKLGAVDLTFFSSFPRFGIRIKNACIVSDKLNGGVDSLRSRRDTIVQFEELRLGLDVEKYLKEGEIKIGRITVISPKITLYRDSTGITNWNILKETADTLGTDSLNADTTKAFTGIALKYINIKNARVRYSDRQEKMFAGVDSLDFLLKGVVDPKNFDIDITINDKKTSFSQNKMRYFRRLPLGLKTKVRFDGATHRFVLQETNVEINGIKLDLDGWVHPDSAAYDLDLNFAVASPSVEALFGIIPKQYIKEEIDVKSGDVSASGSITGRYDEKTMPTIKLAASIGNVKAKYEGMPYGIDELTAEFNTLIDVQKPKDSYANINIFHFKGAESEIKAKASAKEIFLDPIIDCDIQSHIDLTTALQLFPIQNITMSGSTDANIKASFKLSQLERQDIGKIKINGTLDADDLKVESDSLRLKLNSDMHLKFASVDTMSIRGKVTQMNLAYEDMRIRATQLRISTKALSQRDTSAVSPLRLNIRASRLHFRQDSIMIFTKNVRSRNEIKASAANKKLPQISVSLKVDTIMSNFYGTRGYTRNLNTKIQLEKVDTIWNSNATALFDEVRASTPAFALPLLAYKGDLAKVGTDINLNNIDLKIGQTDLSLNGHVSNLIKSLMTKTQVVANLNVKSDTINFNQLMSAIVEEPVKASMTDEMSDTTFITKSQTAAVDSITTMQLVKIPRNIRFTLATNVKNVIWNKITVNDIKGKVEVANAAFHMSALRLRQHNSVITATIAYKANQRRKTAEANLCLLWDKADIAYIVDALGLDTIMPMLQPLRGQVTCALATNIQLDSMMNYDLHKIKAGIHINASKLTLMDGETFAKISKILMFKNKKENVIDTISLNIMANEGKIEILPFVANIDRYRAIVGGDQDIEMTKLNYHVSIVKSPLPFKAGVNLTGSPDDIDIDITRAKLKNHADPEIQAAYDKLTYNQRLEVVVDCYRLSRLEMPAALKAVAVDTEAMKLIEKARARSRRIEKDTTDFNPAVEEKLEKDSALISVSAIDTTIVATTNQVIDSTKTTNAD